MEPADIRILLPQTPADMTAPKKSLRKALPSQPQTKKKAKAGNWKERHYWSPYEAQLILAYLQWSVDNNVDFNAVAVPRFIEAVEHTINSQQIHGKLKNFLKSRGLSTLGMKDLLRKGRDALKLNPAELEEVAKLLADIPKPGAEPSIAIEAKAPEDEQVNPSEDGKSCITQTPEEPCQVEMAGEVDHNNQQLVTANSLVCVPSDHADTMQQQSSVTAPLSNKRKVSELESQLFSSQNETAYLKRQLKELPNCAPDAEALNTYRGYHQASLNQSSREKAFDVNNPGMSGNEISRAYTALFEQIQCTCEYVAGLDGVMPGRDANFSELAKLWAYQTFKKDLEYCIKDVQKEVLCEEELLAGLLTAAVIEGVFEPTFPHVLEASWPTSNPYREYILHSQGPTALHIADSTALPVLVSDRKSDIIGKEVENLHQLFSKSLEVFWQPQDCHQTQNTLNYNDVDLVEVPTQSPNLRQFLYSAVDLKYRLTSSITRLKYLYFQPQDIFDERRMVRCKGSTDNSWRIKFCFFPMLLYAPPRPSDTSSDEFLLEHNARYNMYFVNIGTENPTCLTMAAKAIVLT
ncbi:hypothetical protein ACHAPU_008550 [Fusarium lateritium]